MRSNDFDSVAKWYDRLSNLVFGSDIKEAQRCYLKELPIDGRLLIIGGGTGWILKEIGIVRPNLKVDYVEYSAKMIELSKNVKTELSEIQFIHGSERDIPKINYDAVMTNFFLDVFDPNRLGKVMEQLKSCMAKEGVWLCTDFREAGKWYQDILIWVMHVFFRLVVKLDAKTLVDFNAEFQKIGLETKNRKYFFKGMIFAAAYKLTSQ